MTPPLRPHDSEIRIYENIATHLVENSKKSRFRVLLLGITPEIVHMSWPDQVVLTAVDRSEAMISEFWPGDIPGRRKVVMTDWFDMPFQDSSFELIIGDGVFNFMTFPEGFDQLAYKLSKILDFQGKLCIRIFNQSPAKEDPNDLLEEFRHAQSVDYYGFRLRLATSWQNKAEDGIYITKRTLDDYLIDHGILPEELYRKSGHTPPKLVPVKEKDGKGERITYPTNTEFRISLDSVFKFEELFHGDHSLSHRTPIFLFKLYE